MGLDVNEAQQAASPVEAPRDRCQSLGVDHFRGEHPGSGSDGE